MNVVPAHVYMVLVLIMLTATLVLVMMATLEPIVKQVCHIKFKSRTHSKFSYNYANPSTSVLSIFIVRSVI